jgi:hypothetical protein
MDPLRQILLPLVFPASRVKLIMWHEAKQIFLWFIDAFSICCLPFIHESEQINVLDLNPQHPSLMTQLTAT